MTNLLACFVAMAIIGCASGGRNGEIAVSAVARPEEAKENTYNKETAKMLFEEGAKRMKENPRVALEIFAEVSRLVPEIWTPNYNSALSYIKLREFKKAEAELNYSLNKKAPPTMIYNTLGTVYLYLDNKQKAIEVYEKSLAGERTATALINLANLYHLTGQSKSALRCLHELEIIAPANKTAYYSIGLIWYKMGRYKDAEEAFEKMLNNAKGDTRVLYLKAQALLKQGKYDSALKVFQDMAAANMVDPAPYREMGIVYEIYIGDMERAVENYQAYVNKGGEKSKEVGLWIDIVRNRLSKDKGQGGG